MKAQITAINKQPTRYGDKHLIYAVFFKSDEGKSYKSWIDPNNANFKRWQNHLKVGNVLDGLNVVGGNLVDADSFPKLVGV